VVASHWPGLADNGSISTYGLTALWKGHVDAYTLLCALYFIWFGPLDMSVRKTFWGGILCAMISDEACQV